MIRDTLLPEFDHEIANTRKVLERVPEDRPEFRPHDRSMTLARLAGHVAGLPYWGLLALTRNEVDLAPREPDDADADVQVMLGGVMTSRAGMLDAFDAIAAELRTRLTDVPDDLLLQKWTLKKGGHVLLTMPRLSVLRLLFLNHMIHHRAQLGVYLRLNDVPVPPLYGPTADEY